MKIIICIFLLSISHLLSQTVKSINGVPSNGNIVRILGEGFGKKNPAAPLKWDNFENGEIGKKLENGWYTETREGPHPTYVNDILRKGSSVSVKQDYTYGIQYNNIFGLVNQSVDKVYITFYKYVTTSGGGCRNHKPIGLRGGSPGQWDTPEFRHDIYPETKSGHCYGADCNGKIVANSWKNGYKFPTGTWNRVEYYVDMGTPGTATGAWYFWWDHVLQNSWINFVYRSSSCNWSNIYIQGFFARDRNNAAAYIWNDDVYIDITQARVEISDTETWSTNQHREIQIPISWSDNSIDFQFNQGSFENGDQVYLFVIDSNGAVNVNGYPVKIGYNVDAPASPTWNPDTNSNPQKVVGN